MINSLTEKLGEETIFSTIQAHMYGVENQRQAASQRSVGRRASLPGDSLMNERGCNTAETSDGNYDQVTQT